MSIEKEDIPQLLRDLKVSREIEDAYQILELNRDGKWSIRLLMLSCLLKENVLQSIREFVDFGFSKTTEDSLFQRFNLKRIRSNLALPEKWLSVDLITGSGNARNILSKRSDLFTKIDSRYVLNVKSGSRKLALVLLILLLRASRIDLERIPEEHIEDDESNATGVYQQLFLTDSDGKPTRIFHEIQDMIENHPVLAQESEFSKDTRSIPPYIQTAILNLLLQHDLAFSKSPQRKKLTILFDSIYNLSAFEGDMSFNLTEWLNRHQGREEVELEKIDEQTSEISAPATALLLGGAGSGKSFWMIQQTAKLWNDTFKSAKTKSDSPKWIPIFLELGLIYLDKTIGGEALVYGEERSLLWKMDEKPSQISGNLLIARSLDAMLKKLYRSVPKILDRIDWNMGFVLFLDGWDELGHRERRVITRFIESCQDNELPCIISSRIRDSYLDGLAPSYLILEAPPIESCREYLRFRGMEESVLDKINEWFPILNPLDLEILGRIPKMEEISHGRVPVYRSWIEFQVLSSIRANIPHDLQSRSEINQIIEGEFYGDKSLNDLIRSRDAPHSVWSYLPHIAYLQREGRNTSLSYNQVVQDNPLLKELLERRYGSGDSPHPEISRNNLIPYLSAEYIFRSYLSGKYPPIRGDFETFRFLMEILSSDPERRKTT
ncbi:MAG: hypothetical protein ACW98Y_21120 [Candidatus Thorarchaeota archaeon]